MNQQILTYDFTGDGITIAGLGGLIFTAIILFTVFNRYNNSPLRK
jgi:hypothetical protein